MKVVQWRRMETGGEREQLGREGIWPELGGRMREVSGDPGRRCRKMCSQKIRGEASKSMQMEMSRTTILSSPMSSICKSQSPIPTSLRLQTLQTAKGFLFSSLAPWALAITLISPLTSTAAPYPPFPPSTPYTQSQKLQLGLENGKIRPCPSTNPGCVSTNPNSSSFAFPWMIPDNYSGNAIQSLRDAILKTQGNVKFVVDEETPDGHYLRAEVDGGFGRDVMEFLVKRDVVGFRSMARKVTYIYPFTTALGDSKGQIERINKIREELGWYAPNFESME